MLRRRPLCLLCLLVAGILGIFHIFKIPLMASPPGMAAAEAAASANSAVVLLGTVEECETQDDYTFCILHRTRLIDTSDPSFSFHSLSTEKLKTAGKTGKLMKVRLTFQDARHYPAGERLLVRGIPKMAEEATNRGQFDQASYDRLMKISFRMKEPEILLEDSREDPLREGMIVLRSHMRKRIADAFPKDEAGVVACMLLGDKSLLSDDTRSLWQMGGISHMLAISGLHLTALGMGLYWLLRKMRAGSVSGALLCIGALGVYTVFTGLAVSTVRAFFMFLLLMLGRLLGRSYDSPTACAVAALLILLENPYYLTQPSFVLSFLAVLIVNFMRNRSGFTMSYMLTLGMLPAVLLYFYEIPLFSLPVNLLLVPLMPLLLALCMLGAGGGSLFHGLLALPASLLLHGIHTALRGIGSLPFASLILGKPSLLQVILYTCLLLVFAGEMKKWRLYKRRMAFFLMVPAMIFVIGFHPKNNLVVTALDVGQGDGICMELPGGRNLLVDAGSSTVMNVGKYRVLPFLKAEGIRRIDYMVATHMDSDHISGLEELLTMIANRETPLRVDTLVMPLLRQESEESRHMKQLAEKAGARILYVSAGDSILFPGLRVDVLNPVKGEETIPPDENAECLVLSVSYRAFDVLLTGDVENAGETQLIERLQKNEKTYEVLKVAHHGSRNSTPADFLKIVNPGVSIISSGKGNRYGHPHSELLARLEKAGTRIVRTDQSGAVTVISDGKKYKVLTYRSSSLLKLPTSKSGSEP